MAILMSCSISFYLGPNIFIPAINPAVAAAPLKIRPFANRSTIFGHGLWQSDVMNSKLTMAVPSDSVTELESASTIVSKFYAGINSRDLGSVEQLIAENCVYEDLVFPQPFIGRKAILQFFNKFTDSVGSDLQFVIDDISKEDSSGVGVTWHLEWRGRAFPFSKGCSFYRLQVVNGQKQIIYGRDSVEPAIKPGEAALVAIRGIAWLLQQFPGLAQRL